MPSRFLTIPLVLLIAGVLGACTEQPTASIADGTPADSNPPTPTSAGATPPAPSGAPQAASPAPAPAAPAADAVAGSARELEWDALIPDDYRPDKLMAEFKVEELSDDDPRAAEFMEKLKALWDQAPVREDLDGTTVKLPGFVVPVEGDDRETTGFLLVPYYGACIHVPPPPANQTVYVVTEAGKGTAPGLFDVVWVTGTMSVKRIANDMAEAGYTLYASDVSPYE